VNTTPRSYRLAPAARSDIVAILDETAARFGTRQHEVYGALIAEAIRLVTEDPLRLAARDRSDILPGLRAFSLELAAGRRGAASHVLYYAVRRLASGVEGVIIYRVLHRAMDPARHVAGPLD